MGTVKNLDARKIWAFREFLFFLIMSCTLLMLEKKSSLMPKHFGHFGKILMLKKFGHLGNLYSTQLCQTSYKFWKKKKIVPKNFGHFRKILKFKKDLGNLAKKKKKKIPINLGKL